MKQQKYEDVYLNIDVFSNAVDSLITCNKTLDRDDNFKWKWAAISILHSLFMFCIANLEGGNYDNVLCYDDDDDNKRFVKIGNDEKWKRSRKIYRQNSKGYNIKWDYINGEPSFPKQDNNKTFERHLISFWSAIARVQDEEVDMRRYIFSKPVKFTEDQWKSIELLYSYGKRLIYFIPTHWGIFIDDFKYSIKNLLPVIRELSMEGNIYLFGKEYHDEITKTILEIGDKIDGVFDNASDFTSKSQPNSKNNSEVIIYTEGNNVIYLNKAKEYFAPSLKIVFHNCGGKNELQNDFKRKIENNHSYKTLYLFDSDVTSEYEDCNKKKNSSIIPLRIPLNLKNKKEVNGIENLFDDNLFEKRFYDETKIIRNDTIINEKKNLRKKDFCDYICNVRNKKEDFEKFKVIFEMIKKEL